MSKTFRPWKIDEPLLLPAQVRDFVAADHLARFVLSLVRDEIDLAVITSSYDSDRGQPPFDPVMMTALHRPQPPQACSGADFVRRAAASGRIIQGARPKRVPPLTKAPPISC